MTPVTLPDDVVAAARTGRAAVLEAVAGHGGTPLRFDVTVTLIHVGVADGVAVRHWLDIFPPIPAFSRMDGTDLWATSFEFPADARIEYKLAIRRRGRRRLTLDRFNPVRAPNPWGFNSELLGAGYRAPQWVHRRPAVARGSVTRHDFDSEVYGEERSLHIYRPAGGRVAALLVVHDGSDYLHFAGLTNVLDNLIATGDIPPVAAVLTDPGDRFAEYRASAAHAAHVVDEVLPLARSGIAADRIVAIGASLGGVAALHTAWAYPDVFAGLVLQAGSFVAELGGPFRRGPVFAPVARFLRRFTAEPRPLPPRVHVSCGRFDGLVNEAQVIAELLAGRDVDVGYADIAAGHDWHTWRDLLGSALVHVVGKKEA